MVNDAASRDHVSNFNVVVTGERGVGKSFLVIRWLHDHFNSLMPSIPSAVMWERIFKRGNHTIKLHFSDASGFTSPDECPRRYFQGADAVLIVYDLSNRQTFLNIQKWYTFVKCCIKPSIFVFLIGNKADKEDRTVYLDEVKKFAISNTMLAFETSAVTGEGMEKALWNLVYVLGESVPGMKGSDVTPRNVSRGTRSRWFSRMVSCLCCCGRPLIESPSSSRRMVTFRSGNSSSAEENQGPGTSAAPSDSINRPANLDNFVVIARPRPVPSREEILSIQRDLSERLERILM